MNRQDALAAGLPFYRTGKLCRNGHDSDRYSKTGHCVACLRDARERNARIVNTSLAARAEGSALFTYKLHPDDHAAALAFCQALDMQRGRTPSATQAVASVATPEPAQRVPLPELIARHREHLEQTTHGGESASYLPGEMAAALKGHHE